MKENEESTFYDKAEFFVKPLGQVAIVILALRVVCSLVRPNIIIVEKHSS